MLRAIIIDDEQIGLASLKQLIELHSTEVRLVAVTTEAEKGVALIEDYRPDIVFLDINMPGMNGFELLEQLRYKDFKLVFTTAHEKYALQAIKNKACDYLLKPIDVNELKACIANISSGIDKADTIIKSYPAIVEIAVKDGVIFIRPQDIIRLEASGSYTIFYLINQVRHVASKTLKEYEAILDPILFYRCHNSHLVNLSRVIKLISHDGFFAQMDDGSKAEIARKNKEIFLEKFKK